MSPRDPKSLAGRTVRVDKRSYTPPVTARKLAELFAGAGALLVASAASAAPAPTFLQTSDTARAASQAAQAAADAADEIADADLDAPPAKDKSDPLQKARDGIVVLERGGKALGMGSVLAGDGRILTALSSLGHGNDVDARFADGSVSRVRVGHSDRGWDLALLIPQNSRWRKGLKASRKSATAAGTQLRSFSMIGAKDVALSRTIVKGKSTLLGGDSELLRDALDLASRVKPSELGTPVLDEKGDVVAVIARACAPVKNGPCSMVPFGVPISAVKAFLRTVPENAVPPAPWLGLQGVADVVGPVRGVRVLGVHPQSPAAAAGMKGGSDKSSADVVVAVDGIPVTTPEALAETINQRSVGESVELLLFGGGKFRRVTLGLRPAPDATPKAKAAPAPKARVAPKPRSRE
jgi:serine protease Do